MKVVKKIIISVISVCVLFVCISLGFIQYALGNGDRQYDENYKWDSLYVWYPHIRPWADSVRNGKIQYEWLVNTDGDSIRMYVLPAARKTKKTVVLTHGYKDCGIAMMHLGYMYHHDLGYNVISYDQYAHGESEGTMIQMGWKDRKNLIMCAKEAEKIFGDTIVLHGISMGGATVMMASGDNELPPSVRAIVDDCGYTSVWDEYVGEIKNQFGLPSFPILHVTSLVNKLFWGWDFKEASALESVKRTQVPMLFIHGDNDTFVPTEMVYRLYDAHQGKKALWLSEGSEHALSYFDHREQYTQKVMEFLKVKN